MADRLQLIPGAAALSAGDPPIEDNPGIVYENDGADHKAGWSVFVPYALRSQSPLVMRFALLDMGAGIGTVPMLTTHYSFGDSGAILSTGSKTISFIMVNVPLSLVIVDVDISTWIEPTSTTLLLELFRNSGNPADTYGDDAIFFNARTL